LAAGAAGLLIAAGTLWYLKLRRRKTPAELERLRRLFLTRHGRITTGEMIDLVEEQESSALMLVYRYDVAGVTYEVAQDLSMLPAAAALAARAIGGAVSVRYDMKQPSNSIVVSEDWTGILEPGGAAAPSGTTEAEQKS
jgi:hypothetical protein